MNKSLRQLFTIVVALFVILGMSTTIITAIRANQLNNDPRNTRALYHEYGAPRGAILASDGSVIAKSDPSNDAFSYQRSYTAGELYAPVTGFFSISQRGWNGIEASRSSLLSGQSDQLVWQRFKSLFTGQENKGATIETSIDPKIQQAAYNGLANNIGALFGAEPQMFLMKDALFNDLYVWSGVWQATGYGAVIYIAALAGVSPDLHEAATIDGATRLQRIIHINLPAIMPTIVIMLIMAVGGIMNLSFEKVLLMQTDSNTAVSEVISTYVYKLGIQRAQYSLSAAVGLFNNIINLILLVTVNKVSRKISETSLW